MTDEKPTPQTPETQPQPKEIGGRNGPDPVRYGDWENGGKCVDF
jgi:hypothetical protein